MRSLPIPAPHPLLVVILLAGLGAGLAAADVDLHYPSQGEVVPHESVLQVQVVVPATVSTATATVGGFSYDLALAELDVQTGADGRELVTAYYNPWQDSSEVSDIDGTVLDGTVDVSFSINGGSYTANWSFTIADDLSFDYVAHKLPPLAGDEETEVSDVHWQEPSSSPTEVWAVGVSIDTDTGGSTATLWTYDIGTEGVGTTEISLAAGTFGLASISGSAAYAVNAHGIVAGTVWGPDDVDATLRAFAWIRESDGTIRNLVEMASGADLGEEPEILSLTGRSTVWDYVALDRIDPSGWDVDQDGTPDDTGWRATIAYWDDVGGTAEVIDVHAELMAELSINPADYDHSASVVTHIRESGAFGGVVYDPANGLVPFIYADQTDDAVDNPIYHFDTTTTAPTDLGSVDGLLVEELLASDGSMVFLTALAEKEQTALSTWNDGSFGETLPDVFELVATNGRPWENVSAGTAKGARILGGTSALEDTNSTYGYLTIYDAGFSTPQLLNYLVSPADREALNGVGNGQADMGWPEGISVLEDESLAFIATSGWAGASRGLLLVGDLTTGGGVVDEGGILFAAGSDDFSTHAIGAWTLGAFSGGVQYEDTNGTTNGLGWSSVGAYTMEVTAETITWGTQTVDAITLTETFADLSVEYRKFAIDSEGDLYLLETEEGQIGPPVLYLPSSLVVGTFATQHGETWAIVNTDVAYEGFPNCVHLQVTGGDGAVYDEYLVIGDGSAGWTWADDTWGDKMVRSATADTGPTPNPNPSFSAGSDDFSDHPIGFWTLGSFPGGTAEFDSDGLTGGFSWATNGDGIYDQVVSQVTVTWNAQSVDGVRVDEDAPTFTDFRVFAQDDDGDIYLIQDGDGDIVPPVLFLPSTLSAGQTWDMGGETFTIDSVTASWDGTYSPTVRLTVSDGTFEYEEHIAFDDGPVGYIWADSIEGDRIVRSNPGGGNPSFDGTSASALGWTVEDHFALEQEATGVTGSIPDGYDAGDYARYLMDLDTITFDGNSVDVVWIDFYGDLQTTPKGFVAYAEGTDGAIYNLIDDTTGDPLTTAEMMISDTATLNDTWSQDDWTREITSLSASYAGYTGLIEVTKTYTGGDFKLEYYKPGLGPVGFEYIDPDTYAIRHQRVDNAEADAVTMAKIFGGFDIDVDPNWETITLYDDYHYVHFVYDGGDAGAQGVEHGYWRIDSVSGDVVTVTLSSAVDETANSGPTTAAFETATFPLTVSDAGIDSGDGLMARATDSGEDLVGSWEGDVWYYDPAGFTLMIAFFPNGRYVHYEDQDPGGDLTVSVGYDIGTWSYDGTDLSTTKVDDQNGDYGPYAPATRTDVGATTLTYDVIDDPSDLYRVGPQIFYVLPNTDPMIDTFSPVDEHVVSVPVTMSEDNAVAFSLTLFAADAEDDFADLTWSISSAASNGTAGTAAGGGSDDRTITYSPNADFNGGDSFVVRVTDLDGGFAETTINVTVDPVNDPPVNTAGPTISGTQSVGATWTADPGTWNDDLDGNPGPIGYSYQWYKADDDSGTNEAAVGSDSDSYVVASGDAWLRVAVTATDAGNPGSETAVATSAWTKAINLDPTITPSGGSITQTIDEDEVPTAFTDVILAGADGDGGTLAWAITTEPTNGSANLSAAVGSPVTLSYDPDPDYNGADSLVVTLSDGQGGSDTVTIDLTIDPQDDVATADDLLESTDEAVDLIVTLSGATVDGTALSYRITALPAVGSLTQFDSSPIGSVPATVTDASARVIYVPPADVTAPGPLGESFTYEASDDAGGNWSGTGTVSIDVAYVNDDPVVTVADASGNEDEVDIALSVSVADVDPEGSMSVVVGSPVGSSLSATASGAASLGGVGTNSLTVGITGNDLTDLNATLASLTFTPPQDAIAVQSLTVTATDGGAAEDSDILSVTLTPQNDLPEVSGQSLTVTIDEDGDPTAFTSQNLSATDVESDDATLDWSIVGNPTGSVTLDGGASVTDSATATLAYVPAADATGSDNFTIRVTDGDGGQTDLAYVITIDPVNDVPSFTSGGDVTVAEDSGAYDAAWASDLSVGPASEAGQSLVGFTVTGNTNGALFASGPAIDVGTGNLSFTPADDAAGVATITVALQDDGGTANGGSDTSSGVSFDITVTAANDDPVIAVDSGSATQTFDEDEVGTGYTTVSLSANDVDDDNATLAWSITTQGTLGTAVLSGANPGATIDVDYTPLADANGSDTVVVTVVDDEGGFDTITFDLTLSPINDDPVLTLPGTQSVVEDSTGNIAGSLAVSDIDGDVPTITVTPAAGTVAASGANVTISGAGTNGDPLVLTPNTDLADLNAVLATLTLTPVADYAGPTSVDLAADDGNTGTANGTILVNVQSVADAPSIAIAGALAMAEDAAATVLNADAATFTVDDADSASLTVTLSAGNGVLSGLGALSGVTGTGTAVLSGTGSPAAIETALAAVTYQPDADYVGVDAVAISVDDGSQVASDDLLVTVSQVNDDPVATTTSLAATIDANGSVSFNIGASDIDGDALGLVEITGPSTGTTGYSGLQATYTDTGGVAGSDSFTFEVDDGNGGRSATITVSITVVVDDPGTDEAPVLTAPASFTTAEDTAGGVTGISVADQDSASLTLTVASSGSFGLSGFTSPMTDTAANINSAIAGLTLTPDADANGSGTIDLTLSDATTTLSATIAVTITAVNDAPILTGSGTVPAIDEDAAPTAPVAVGGLTVSPGGGPDEAGQGFSAALVGNTNPALFLTQPRLLFGAGGAISVVYGPRANASGSADVTFEVFDDGGLSAGPTGFTITVNPVNDPPRFAPGSRIVVPGVTQIVTIPGWATGIDGGAGEADTVTFDVAVSDAALNGATLSSTGELQIDVQGVAAGTTQTVILTITANDGTDDTVKTAEVVVDASGSPLISAPTEVNVLAWDTDGYIDIDPTPGQDASDPSVDTTPTTTVIAGISLNDDDSSTLSAIIAAGNPDAVLELLSGDLTDDDATADATITLTNVDQTLLKQVLNAGFTYTPADGAVGAGEVTVTISDGDGGTADGVATIAVNITIPVDQGAGDSSTATADADDPDAKAVGDFSLLYVPIGQELTLSDLEIDRLVITWDPDADDWRIVGPNESLDPSVGYWIEPGPAIDSPETAGIPARRMTRELTAGWNPFTVPFGPGAGDVPWDLDGLDAGLAPLDYTIRVLIDSDNDGTIDQDLTLGEAYAGGWVEHVVWCLDASGYTPVIPDDASPPRDNDSGGTVPSIQPGKSYMFRALQVPPGGTITLEIESTQIVSG